MRPTGYLLSLLRPAACLLAGLGAQPAVGEQQLLPDINGQMQSVAISVNSARHAALRNADLVGHIVNGLPTSVKIDILTNDREAFTVARNPWPERIDFLELPFTSPITIWTQDPFLVLRDTDNGNTTLLTSKAFERADDDLMAAKIAAANGYDTRASELYFEGGNIVSDERSVFIGANTIRYNAAKLERDEVDVVLAFQRELGRRVLVIGPLPQPVAHIDMVLTPLGNNRVALADAAAGARIAEQALADDPASVSAFERYCEDYFFGHPAIREIRIKPGEFVSAPDMQGTTKKMIELSKQVAPMLDGIARSLETFGYRVERIPFLFGGPESLGPPAENEGTLAGYPMLTYNNVLLESGAGKSTVYLPEYGWPQMDNAASAAWQALGYKPEHIKGLTVSAMYGGALRCSVKVLERAQPPGNKTPTHPSGDGNIEK